MAIDSIWILPVFICFYSILTLLVCYSVSAAAHHVPPRWPFLRQGPWPSSMEDIPCSEIATSAPEACLHSMMNNHMAILLAVWMVVKHWEVSSYLGAEGGQWRRLSAVAMVVGLMAALTLQISANFPARRIKFVEQWATVATTSLWSVYILLHSIVSLCIVDPSVPRKGLFVVRLCVVGAVISMTATLKLIIFFGGVAKEHNQAGMEGAVESERMLQDSWAGPLSEWGVYMALAFFLLIDSYEFRSLSVSALKLIIPGSPLYERVEQVERDRSWTETSDYDPRLLSLRSYVR